MFGPLQLGRKRPAPGALRAAKSGLWAPGLPIAAPRASFARLAANAQGSRPSEGTAARKSAPAGLSSLAPGSASDRLWARTVKLEFKVQSKTWEILLIALRNALLMILTLTFYRFWARTRVRRYLWSRTSLLDEPIEYTGSSLELLIGFLITLAIFGVPLVGASLAVQLLDEGEEVFALLYALAINFGLFFFYGVAKYRAQSYRLSRSIWRGIRFGLKGSSVPYGLKTLGLFYLTGLTLFWTYPIQRVSLMRQMLKHTTFGDRQLQFTGQAGPLYPSFAIAWLLSIVGLLAAAFGVVLLLNWLREQGILPSLSEEQLGTVIAGPMVVLLALFATVFVYALIGVVLALTTAWYSAKEFRYFAECTSLDGLRFRFRAGGLAMFWLSAVNVLIIFLTFGLGLPLAQMRKFRFFFRRLSAEGEIDLDNIGQSDAPYPWFGEGLAEFFDLTAV